jgi:hypothetical protein
MTLIRISDSAYIQIRQIPCKAGAVCHNPTPNCVRLLFSVFSEDILISKMLSVEMF